MPKVFITVLLLLIAPICRGQEIRIVPPRPDGVYALREPIKWRIGSVGEGITDVSYTLKKGGWTVIKEGPLDMSAGPVTIETSLDEPNTLLLEVKGKANGKPTRVLAGAVVDPDHIRPSAPKPDDFDEFWGTKIQELKVIPPNVTLEAADSGNPDVAYFKIRMDNVNGSHVYGQAARPKKQGPCPAMLIVQWAGVYGLPRTNVTDRAAQGWIALNIMPHDLPFDKPEAFYKQIQATTLTDYQAQGAEDRDKCYFLRMLLGCYRAADYLADRNDWDGKTLIVTGTSQGGYQTLFTAAMHPKVTAMLANVPGGCDMTGPDNERAPGWPSWCTAYQGSSKLKQVMETARYYDAVNFASRIKCPALVSLGLIDETCPPSGVLAAFNQIRGPRLHVIMPNSDHHGTHNSQGEYFKLSEQWVAALAAGKPLPESP